MEEKAKFIAGILKIMANEHRLLLLCALLEKSMSVSALMEKAPSITQSAVSQHLAVLKEGGLVECSRHGREIRYNIKDRRTAALISVLKENYCR